MQIKYVNLELKSLFLKPVRFCLFFPPSSFSFTIFPIFSGHSLFPCTLNFTRTLCLWEVDSEGNLRDMKTAISEPSDLLQANAAAKCTAGSQVPCEPKETQTAPQQGQDFPFDPELCPDALHQSAPTSGSAHRAHPRVL